MKNTLVLLIFLVAGLLIGSLIGEILGKWLPLLNMTQSLTWEPKADLEILQYDLFFRIRLNLASAIGLIAAFWIYRKW